MMMMMNTFYDDGEYLLFLLELCQVIPVKVLIELHANA